MRLPDRPTTCLFLWVTANSSRSDQVSHIKKRVIYGLHASHLFRDGKSLWASGADIFASEGLFRLQMAGGLFRLIHVGPSSWAVGMFDISSFILKGSSCDLILCGEVCG